MLRTFEKHIHCNFPFLSNKKLLIATSGGIDSVALTHLLHLLQFKISLAHCNFRLRGIDSDTDEIFIKTEAEQLKINCFTTSFNTEAFAKKNGISIQMAARELRYNWFEEIRKNNHFDYILTAHHADDNLETFLINLSRGTGLDGLTGIPAVNNSIVRPLLPFSRKEIITFVKNNNLLWREDKSNTETKYLRNKLRHDIIPLLKELNPNFITSFTKTIENLQGSKQVVTDKIAEVEAQVIHKKEDVLELDIQKIKALKNPKIYLFEILKTYGFSEWEDVYNLLEAQTGKNVFSSTHRLIKNRNFLLLSRVNSSTNRYDIVTIAKNVKGVNILNKETSQVDLKLKIEQVLPSKIEQYKTNKNRIHIDEEALKYPLYVRKWEKGDYFYPIGMEGKKKLSKYFKDEKLSLLDKESIWLLCSENKIVWIIGKRLDNRFKIDKNTTKILKIEIVE